MSCWENEYKQSLMLQATLGMSTTSWKNSGVCKQHLSRSIFFVVLEQFLKEKVWNIAAFKWFPQNSISNISGSHTVSFVGIEIRWKAQSKNFRIDIWRRNMNKTSYKIFQNAPARILWSKLNSIYYTLCHVIYFS